ncbi:histidine phosphatase family protein [Pseudonocardia sp. N23]|uniref:histidine phosphatase family protein n=1 Tax=Pseudonocardia sp. N23 TaxID=1987376 RepID=UPI000BFC4644|nr:histidine phosphatase family protein [Pseudonocardia sp. N23]
MYEVVLLRHGETLGYDGDHGLTPRGEEQARARGKALAAEIAPGTRVLLPHARTSRATATAVTLRAALVAEGVDESLLGALYTEPHFDNLRFSLDGEVVDTSVAVGARLELGPGPEPDWVREYDRFDSDYRDVAAAGGPIEFWVHEPTLYFEPPQVAVLRTWLGVAALGPRLADAGAELALVCTHSAPMRAFVATTFGEDLGEPENLEPIRLRVEDGEARVAFRDRSITTRIPQPPAWIDRGWLESYGR